MNIAETTNKSPAIPMEVERRLAGALQGILSRAEWLKAWKVRLTSSTGPASDWDLIASGPVQSGKTAFLCVECKLHFQPSQISTIASRPCDLERRQRGHRVLGMPHVSSRMASLCEANGWSWFDLAGNCRLEIPGAVLIERSGEKPVRIDSGSSPNLGSPEAARVLRALLAPHNAGRRWTQRDIVAHFVSINSAISPPSLALVNKVVQHLRDEAFLNLLPNRGFRVRDYEGLLKLWRQHYRFERSVRRRYFTLLQPRALSERLATLGRKAPAAIAYNSFSAADVQAPHVRQPRSWVCIGAEWEDEFTKAIEAKEVGSGENMVALIPDDAGVFYGLEQSENRLARTNPVQTYIDLVNSGGRGEEAAEAVLRQRLKPEWKRATDGP